MDRETKNMLASMVEYIGHSQSTIEKIEDLISF